MRDAEGTVVRWYGSNTDIDAEYGARTRERFFSRLGAELAGALSLEQTLRVVTRGIVPEFADWALVNLIDERNDVRLAAAFHRDPHKRDMLDACSAGSRTATPRQAHGTAQVVRTGKPVVYRVRHRSRAERVG